MVEQKMEAISQAIAYFKLDVVNMQIVEESYSSDVRILVLQGGEHLVLKVPFIHRKLQREVYALEYLGKSLPVPQVLDVWQPDDERPGAFLMTYLPGKVLTGRGTPSLAYEMGWLLARLHTHRLPNYGEAFDSVSQTDDDWWDMLKRRFQSWQLLCAGVLEPALFQRCLEAFAYLSTDLPEPDGPCYAHYDYRPGNILVQDECIRGLIDFESARGGSADLDFIKVNNEVWGPAPECRQPFLEGYGSIRKLPEIERTLPFYALGDAFGGIAWCVKRDKLDDPFFEVNLRRLKKIVNQTKTTT